MLDDDEPITDAWLDMMGFESVPSDVFPESNTDRRKGRLQIWEFNDTGKWLFNDADWITFRTRGDIRAMCKVCKIALPTETVAAMISAGF